MNGQHTTPPSGPSHTPTPQGFDNLVSMAESLDDDDGAALSLDALARACRMDADWVLSRLQDGLLPTAASVGASRQNAAGAGTAADAHEPTGWVFSSTTVVRARRLAHLEITFDADPHLAALTADLIEEVLALRQRLQHLSAQR